VASVPRANRPAHGDRDRDASKLARVGRAEWRPLSRGEGDRSTSTNSTTAIPTATATRMGSPRDSLGALRARQVPTPTRRGGISARGAPSALMRSSRGDSVVRMALEDRSSQRVGRCTLSRILARPGSFRGGPVDRICRPDAGWWGSSPGGVRVRGSTGSKLRGARGLVSLVMLGAHDARQAPGAPGSAKSARVAKFSGWAGSERARASGQFATGLRACRI
jgi:hypothetical protein